MRLKLLLRGGELADHQSWLALAAAAVAAVAAGVPAALRASRARRGDWISAGIGVAVALLGASSVAFAQARVGELTGMVDYGPSIELAAQVGVPDLREADGRPVTAHARLELRAAPGG